MLQLAAQNKLYSIYISFLMIYSFYLSSRLKIPIGLSRSLSAFLLSLRPAFKLILFLLILLIPFLFNNLSLSAFDLSSQSSGLIYTKESLSSRSALFRSFPFVNYLLLLFRYLFGPLLIVLSLRYRNNLFLLAVLLSFFVLSINASSKIDLVIPLIVLIFYRIARISNIVSFPFSLSIFLSLLLFSSILLLPFSPFLGLNRVFVGLFMRALYILVLLQ